jgi:Domain of unknown function (DUF4397)
MVKLSFMCLARSISRIAGVFALLAVFCLQASPVSAESPSFVRIIHAAPGIGTADVFVDGTVLLSSFQFASVTGYATIPPGPHKVQIALVGKGSGASVITQTLAVSPGAAFTVAALGTQSTGFSLQVFTDNNQLATGQAKVRFYHLSPDIGSVNVSNGGSTVVSGLAYPQASNYLTMRTGAYTFDVSATQSNVTLPVSATLQANMVTSVFAVGMANGTPPAQIVTAQTTGLPGSPNTGSDPNPSAAPGSSQSPMLWLFGVFALVVFGSGALTRRLANAHRRAKTRA